MAKTFKEKRNMNSINKAKLYSSYKECVDKIIEIQRIYKIYFNKGNIRLDETLKEIHYVLEEILKAL